MIKAGSFEQDSKTSNDKIHVVLSRDHQLWPLHE